MILKLKFEHIVLADVVGHGGRVHVVAQQGKTGEGEVVLESFVEVETEVCEDHPQLLPSVAVLELAEQVARQLVLQRPLVVHDGHAGGPVPAHVHRAVRPLSARPRVQRPRAGRVRHLGPVQTVVRSAHGF